MSVLSRLVALIGTVTGLKAGARMARRDVVTARELFGDTVRAVREVRYRAQGPAGGVETFEEAVARQGLNEADLDERYGEFTTEAWTLGILGIGIWALLGYFLVSGVWLGALGCMGLAPAVTALAARASFRAWQIRARRLGLPREWLRRPGEWWPPGRREG